MNTTIGKDSSNDCSEMSPALTQDQSQDVVNNDHDKPSLIEKCKTSIGNSIARSILQSTEHFHINADEVENSSSTLLCPPKNGSLYIDSTTLEDDLIHNLHKNHENNKKNGKLQLEMTPRIILPQINTGDHGGMINGSSETDLGNGSKAVHHTHMQYTTAATVPRPTNSQSEAVKMSIPKVEDLVARHGIIEDRTSNAIKRIRHLQSIVASRHTRQQLMTFVECQLKLDPPVLANTGVKASTSQASTSMLCNTSSADLNNMSTPALIDLVQRMQTNTKHLANTSKYRHSTMTVEDKNRVKEATGVMTMDLKRLHEEIDSDATESSSGGETDDEDIERADGDNATPGAITKLRAKACWRWNRDRATVICRWTWLQAQVSDLEYRIRQHGELHRQLRSAKTPLLPGPIPSQAMGDDSTLRAARCMPLPVSSSRRHKLLRVSQAPSLSPKARRPVMVRCQCVQTVRQCAICAGHHNYALPTDIQLYSRRERISQIDPGFHPVLSFSRDVDPSIELEEVVNSSDKKHTVIAPSAPLDKKALRLKKKILAEAIKKQKLALKMKKANSLKEKKEKKKLNKAKKKKTKVGEDGDYHYIDDRKAPKKKKYMKKNKPYVKRERIQSLHHWDDDEDDLEQAHAESSLAQSAPGDLGKLGSTSKRTSSYDIDDIVIPYHIAASTRVEKLQYKEIDTPRWRECLVNGNTVHDLERRRSSSMSVPNTPMTPMTPMLPSMPSMSNIPPTVPLSVKTATDHTQSHIFSAPSTPVPMDTTNIMSEKSSTNSLNSLEFEDISDERFFTRHSAMETKEKARYMNFVTSTRRTRTQSTASGNNKPLASTASPMSPSCPDVVLTGGDTGDSSIGMSSTLSHTPLSHTSSIPLSASHDTTLLKEELSQAMRKRSSSFTANRLKKDQSIDMPEKPVVQPWVPRQFPLVGEAEAALDFNWKPPKPEPALRLSSNSTSSEQWRVISAEEEEENERVVLKLKLTS